MLDKSKLSRKNVSAIEKEFLSKFLDNDEEIHNMFDRDENNLNIEQNKQSPGPNNLNKSRIDEVKKEEKKANLSSTSQKDNVHNFSLNAIGKTKDNEVQYERRLSKESFKSRKDIIPTHGVY